MVKLLSDVYQSAVTFADLQRKQQVERKREDHDDYYFGDYNSRMFNMYADEN